MRRIVQRSTKGRETNQNVPKSNSSERRAHRARRPHRLWAARAALCAFVLMAVAGEAGISALQVSASTSPSQYFTLSVTPTQNLTDGEQMTVTVTRTAAGTAAGLEITWVAYAWCTPTFSPPLAPGPTPLPPATSQFPPKWGITHAHCTTASHPLNADTLPLTLISPQLNGSGDYSTVTGHIPAQTTTGTQLYTYEVTTLGKKTQTPYTLECDSAHPCRFAVAVFSKHLTANEQPVFLSVPVTFATTAPLAGCGGDAPGMVSSVSPNILGPAVTAWTVGACTAGVGGGAVLAGNISSGQGDASALEGFADGADDVAYSAVGYDTTGAFTPSVDRPFVAVPVAIDAVVLAHVQAYTKGSPSGRAVLGDFPQQLQVTDVQAAQLLGGGPTAAALSWSSPLGRSLIAENPELQTEGRYYGTSRFITEGAAVNQNFGIVATSLADATTYFATTFLHTLEPRAMVSDRTAAPLGVTADFGKATPPFNVDSTTTTKLISKALTPNAGQGFALADAATAASMWGGLADFSIQAPSSIGSGSPVYVSPTEASMDAATTEMIPQPDGTLLPNPNATPVDGVQPYPLTFIEYAIAPTQPLLTPTCTPRTSSQQDLKTWLDYITGPGQSELPVGMAPLTPALEDQAQAAITEVGTAKATGSCAPVKGASGSPAGSSSGSGESQGGNTAATAQSSAGPSASGAVATGAFGTNGFGVAGRGPGGQESALSQASSKGGGHGVKRTAAAADLAGFDRVEKPGWLLPALGVLVLVLLLPGLAFLMSGRTLGSEIGEGEDSPESADPAGTGGSGADEGDG
jgi:hypothetical protein